VRITQTERTRIDRIRLEDAPFFVRLVNSPTWLKFIGDRHVSSTSDARTFLRNGFLKSYDKFGYSYFLVRSQQRNSLGICGFLKKPYLDNADFGFAFLPEYQGMGYGYETGRAVLDYGIQQFGFRELDAVTMTINEPSIRLLEKLGFASVQLVDVAGAQETLMLYRWKSQ